ncbi:MAG: hypothetical protein NC092_07240 [Butyrivibrio sp.]|nr:hypothetical protein [Muribaculum sp.]MCM1552471.1 hypothetical protein [Butyrivibrio sp.]
MAKRPAWTIIDGCVTERMFEFAWNGGFAISQKRKNISALHDSILADCGQKALEISTKSTVTIGEELSAFHLKLDGIYLECIFQGSKKFENGGPFRDLYSVEPKMAKRDERLKCSGRLISFVYADVEWALTPKTAFYDYIYVKALVQEKGTGINLVEYDWFTDIEFNPEKSINCQARALTLYKLMQQENAFECLNDTNEWTRYHMQKVKYAK